MNDHFLEWIKGEKHPDTHRLIFKNVWKFDQMRLLLKGRCQLCGYVISTDEKEVKELRLRCTDDPKCTCRKVAGPTVHKVCDLCYYMYRALYVNFGLVNPDYFKNIDEEEERKSNDWRRKDRLGL